MPYCPTCLIEYIDDTTQCEDCGAALLPGPPPGPPPIIDLSAEKDVKLIPVHVFSGGTAQMDADVARNILQSQGIPCMLEGENSAEVLPILDVSLLVREEDAARAGEVLEAYSNASPAEIPEESEPTE